MIARRALESQRAYVERVLRSEGRISTHDVLYGLEYDDGRRCSITRLAAIVHDLRESGWDIVSHVEHGALAVYRLVAVGSREPWRCVDCGTPAILDVSPVLGGMGQSRCDTCRGTRYFRRAAA